MIKTQTGPLQLEIKKKKPEFCMTVLYRFDNFCNRREDDCLVVGRFVSSIPNRKLDILASTQ